MVDLRKWSEIADDFEDTLVLGNGASVALYPRFKYNSLKEEAYERGYLSEEAEESSNIDSESTPTSAEGVFELLGTDDFERVLNLLWHAKYVNDLLSIDEEETAISYGLVKGALVKTVQAVHCEYPQVEGQLQQAQEFMSSFNIVLSLNYDLLVYWALLAGNNNPSTPNDRFMDCFTSDRTLDPDWARHLVTESQEQNSTLVFYPHGNLALTTGPHSEEKKVVSSGRYLLDRILEAWEARGPLFVSEGRWQDKLNTIKGSGYLRTVYGEVMGNLGSTVAIYGWNLSSNDKHLVDRLFNRQKQKAAVSIHIPSFMNDEETVDEEAL